MPLTSTDSPALTLGRTRAAAREPVLRMGPSLISPPDSDGPLSSIVAGRHEMAMRAVVERYRARSLAVAARICGDALAEDVVQEAFLSVWRASATYRPALGSIGAWVLGIVRHRAIDALRRDARHTNHRTNDEGMDALADPEQLDALVIDREESRALRSMLQALPHDQARVISLAYFDGLTHAEIAGRTGVPLGTVKGRLRLGLAKLRAPLDVSHRLARDEPRTDGVLTPAI